MNFEIDVLAVGKKSSGGDAMAIRYGDIHGGGGEQRVVVIDGGYSDDGADLAELIRTRYDTERVDLMVSTHPDQDHTSGLKVMVQELEVGELWLHRPWAHSATMAQLRTQAFDSAILSERAEASLQTASDLESLALERGIPVIEPFTGLTTNDGVVRVLGPSQPYYESLLEAVIATTPEVKHGIMSALSKAAEAAKSLVGESLNMETLSDDVATSPRNNSSVITLMSIGSMNCLFTADAGIPALAAAADELDSLGIDSSELHVVQIPHHGSRRNVGPTVLNRLLGPKGQPADSRTAFVSAPAENPESKHPAKKVTNAFIRRGCTVVRTQGQNLNIPYNAPPRPDYGPAVPIEFFDQVEDG